jgi:AGCS family alanine or glycine:cation symporter
MALAYVLGGLAILAVNIADVPQGFIYIVQSAFTPTAATGGFAGAAVWAALRFGIARGVFSNEAGLGSAPMAHAVVRTSEPMSQGFAALMEPFLDTVIICMLTALVVVVSGVHQTSASEGIALTSDAFATVVPWFPLVLAVVAILFALSTVLSWGYYGEQAWTWLFTGRTVSRVTYRLFLCAVLAVAPTLNINQVVNIVDSLNFCMAIPNLIAVYLFLPELRSDLADYWQRVLKRGT